MSLLVRKFLQYYWSRAKRKDAKRMAAQKPGPGVAQVRDLPYIDDQNPMHLLDIYYPEGTGGLLPLIIDIHGGGWMYGNKELNRYYGLSLAAQGFVVAGMNYRLLPETDLRGQVQDIFACLHWLEAHGREHHCDPERVFITGDSAGGHLAALAICITLNPELQKLYRVTPAAFPFRAAAISHGVCKLRGKSLSGFKAVDREMFRLWFGNKPEENPLYGRSGFEEAAQGLRLPPIMLISSEPDQYHYQSLDMEGYLRSAGGTYRTKFWKREQGKHLGHVFHILYPHWQESRETNQEMIAFFQEF
ncbi:MAG: alpha/beta hydrolase [Spirochaetaceae bacterium]|jgi:acetyl esterase/lipase|nr:alpha/beta hydrolase [Spirochaetaceae bacterium]